MTGGRTAPQYPLMAQMNLRVRAASSAASFISALILAALSCPAPAQGSVYGGAYSSAADDTLAMPGEVFVITAEELAHFDINTLEDLIEHLPGVSVLQDGPPESRDFAAFSGKPLASWIETTFGLHPEPETGRLIRRTPRALRGEEGAAVELANLVGDEPDRAEAAIERFLYAGSDVRIVNGVMLRQRKPMGQRLLIQTFHNYRPI